MKTIKKYTTFEDLKSSEEKKKDFKASIKKHIEFERVIKAMHSIKAQKKPTPKSK